ncbi:MAG: M20 family metallopeptidase [Rhodospirillaceae bacterium]|jgi:acetylornithine deacetylase/succinyl-diaminopimelate desuccinylase-like protein|nr:M20 family metallopeptidase [Rhodospirillaceae bacterium]
MSRAQAVERIEAYFDDGGFVEDLTRRVAIKTESQNPERHAVLMTYLTGEMQPTLDAMGYDCQILDNPAPGRGPFLLAQRHESDDLPTMLMYGHGDVVNGYDDQWRDGLSPWTLTQEGDRLYGRGTADNKGQHGINLAALAAVLETRGSMGFNSKILIETGEETGSPGLREVCENNRDLFAADVLIASDGPRLSPNRPTIFLGARGNFNFSMKVDLRDGGHHSGNWGGLLSNPGIILAHAIASLTSATGEMYVPEWRPSGIPDAVRNAVHNLVIDGGEDAPEIDPDWGEPGLTGPEKVFAWNGFEVLAFTSGNPEHPVNAIPPNAVAYCQIRFTVGVDPEEFMPGLRRFLDARGFPMVELSMTRESYMRATRLSPDDPWVEWAVASLQKTTGKEPAVLPSLGGSLPNDVFADVLGLPTVWVPHSYASCSQHAPNEHMLAPVAREALQIMTGLFWDLGDSPPH